MAANPYVEARPQWDERYAIFVLGKRNRRIAGGGLLAATLASPYTVVAGSVTPAVLISGINPVLPRPILAQVSQNVFDSATGKYILTPQGSRLISAYQKRVDVRAAPRTDHVAATHLSEHLEHESAADAGHRSERLWGSADRVNNQCLAAFGTAALMSLISAGQMVGQMRAFGGGGTYGAYGYYQSNQSAMAGEMVGSAASGQFGGLGQRMIGNGFNRPATIDTALLRVQRHRHADLVFAGPYGK
jgi:type IV secretion system protein TrbI